MAFLGTGIHGSYPPENRELQSRIAREGLVVSQFWPDAPAQKHSFPMRNAVMRMPEHRTSEETRRVLRIAVRQLERADLYLAAVASLEVGDGEGEAAIAQLRDDLESLRRQLVEERTRL